jgi:FKBP-type peptidyl-prolyl cis-trans isomerase
MLARRAIPIGRGLLRGFCSSSESSLITTSSGLMYRDVHVPSEQFKKALDGSTVSVHYTGRLEDGEVFDTSHELDLPISFTLGKREVIRGWEEGIRGMRVGGKRQLVIPPHLGYGAQGAPPAIPPNALLHFDVELVTVGVQPEGFFGRFIKAFSR